jgi:peptidoglycan/LPS O-acetylase OafA/YrhL
LHGSFGVQLFFAISGLVLGIPFAKQHLKGSGAVKLKAYFLRRLTRLEPPYIIVMAIFFSSAVLMGRAPLDDQLSKFFTSLLYINNFLYPGQQVSGVAWSLEIEVQFYVLAPVMALVFAIKHAQLRRVLIVLATVISLAFACVSNLPFISLLDYLHYFLIGFLLADLFVTDARLMPQTRFDWLLGLILFAVIWIFGNSDFETPYQVFAWSSVRLFCVFWLYYLILFHKIFRFLTWRWITNIGGMCYSIYLLHFYLISLFGKPLMRYQFSEYSYVNVAISGILLLLPIAVICSAFYLMVERPCMDRYWYRKLIQKLGRNA